MLKFVDTKVVFAEIPDEITLAINLSGCPIRCPDCHSKYLWEDVGTPLSREAIHELIEKNKGITCIAFMGGDADFDNLQFWLYWIRTRHPELKLAWYSGREEPIKRRYVKNLDYIKIGPYIKELGPLNSKTTNQRLYKVHHLDEGKIRLEDITSRFWKEND